VEKMRVSKRVVGVGRLAAVCVVAILSTSNIALGQTSEGVQSLPPSQQKVARVSKSTPYKAPDTLALIFERVWLTEYMGSPMDTFSVFPSCANPRFSLNINNPPRGIAIPFDRVGAESVWPFKCNPLEIIKSVGSMNFKKEPEYIFRMPDFYNFKNVTKSVVEIVKSGSLGKYLIDDARATFLVKEIVRNHGLPITANQINTSLLSTFPRVERMDSKSSVGTEIDWPSSKVLTDWLLSRLRRTGIATGEFSEVHQNGFVTITIKAYPESYAE
jgi:hypothetical protein